jgi:hypothetical protein
MAESSFLFLPKMELSLEEAKPNEMDLTEKEFCESVAENGLFRLTFILLLSHNSWALPKQDRTEALPTQLSFVIKLLRFQVRTANSECKA